ncbi:MAG: hypothetical protein ACRCRW_06685 [Aeromonadaceae bacterium]
MNQQPLDLLSEDDRKELERLLSIVQSETLSAAAKLQEVARLLSKHGLLIPAPVTEQTWSATELAAELKISAHAVGRLASMHNLKVAGFGEWRLGKAPNGKQIEIWGYNAAGRARLLELMEPANGKNDLIDRMGQKNFP